MAGAGEPIDRAGPAGAAPDTSRAAAMRGLLAQIARFGIAGVLAAMVDYGLLQSAIAMGLGPRAARVPSIGGAMVFAWWLNRRFTFRTPVPPSWAELAAYCSTAAVGALISYGLYAGLLWAGAGLAAAFVVGTIAGAVFNFLRYRIILGRAGGPPDHRRRGSGAHW